MEARRYCDECGKPITPGVQFCEHCGHPISVEATPSITPPPQAPVVPVPAPELKKKTTTKAVFWIAGAVALCVIGLLLLVVGKRVLSTSYGSVSMTQEMMRSARVVHTTMNASSVRNGASEVNMFSITEPTLVTYIMNYHWNNGRGKTPGLIALVHQDKTLYGPWQANGGNGQGGVPNAVWWGNPGVILKPGIYGVIDSDEATWSQNTISGGRGMGEIQGLPWREAKEMR